MNLRADATREDRNGNAFVTAGRFADAEAAYRRAVAFDADYLPGANCNSGNLLGSLGRLGEAAACYQRC